MKTFEDILKERFGPAIGRNNVYITDKELLLKCGEEYKIAIIQNIQNNLKQCKTCKQGCWEDGKTLSPIESHQYAFLIAIAPVYWSGCNVCNEKSIYSNSQKS